MAESDFTNPASDLSSERRPPVALEGIPEVNALEGDFLSQGAREFDMSKNAGLDEGEAPNETRESFSALRESISQGRELKAREKERDALVEQIKADREELADRENILMNYQAIAGEQDAVLGQRMQERQAAATELSDVIARTQEAEQALDRMQSYHAQQLKPLELQLGQAKAAAEQAKNDERSRKSELTAVEGELRKAAEGDLEVVQAKQRLIAAAFNEAKTRTDGAKDVLKQAEKAHDAAKKQFEGEQAPLKKEIKQLKDRADELKGSIESLDDTIARVQERRQFVENVYRNPEETAELRASVASDEAAERRMTSENDELREQFEATRSKARKAKIIVGAVIAVIVVVILLVIFIPKGGSAPKSAVPVASAVSSETSQELERTV